MYMVLIEYKNEAPPENHQLFAHGATMELLKSAVLSHPFFLEDAHADEGGSIETDPWPLLIWDTLMVDGQTDVNDPDYIWSFTS